MNHRIPRSKKQNMALKHPGGDEGQIFYADFFAPLQIPFLSTSLSE